MKLHLVEIEGYRSIRQPMKVVVEPTVTVVLGPNDHGKTNYLNALVHLNQDKPFVDDDLNWDCSENSSDFPMVKGTFTLSNDERMWLLSRETEARDSINRRIVAAQVQEHDDEDEQIENQTDSLPAPSLQQPNPANPKPVVPPTPAAPIITEPNVYDDDNQVGLPDEPLPQVSLRDIPSQIVLCRRGLKGELLIQNLEQLQTDVEVGFSEFFPRFELIDPITKLSDSVSAEDLQPGRNDFMRGIFHYAGLQPDASAELFEQSDRTQMSITNASEKLNETLRESWSQGKDLRFRLTHNSKDSRIELQIQDPSVKSTYVRASRRSSGFTHYFSLKTILHSRQKDHPAHSYVLLFDEPGVFLHPSGQYDLLQVLETLSRESQIIYVTHSLFMINKTFPSRHRLIMKGSDGTTLDGKPYVGRWQSVLSTLGLTLTGSILFANYVLLTEGDSDPIYIFSMIQKAVMAGKATLDITSLSVMSTTESRNADVLLRILWETEPRPKIAVIADGDKGGKERQKYLDAFIKANNVPERTLVSGTSIEDHIPMIREVYVPAVAAYVAKLLLLEGKSKPDESEFADRFLKSFDDKFEQGKVTQGVAQWAESVAKSIGGIDGKPSKVGIAREYATRLLEISNAEFKLDTRTKAFFEWLHTDAGVPELRLVDRKITEE